MRRLLTGLLSATLVLGACGDDDDPEDTAAVTSIPEETSTSTSSTTEPTVPPPDVIPSDPSLITEEYVEQVLDALYEVSLEALLIIRGEGVVEERAIALIEATHSGDTFEQAVNDLIDLTAGGIDTLRQNPEPMDLTVLDLLDVDTDCLVAEVATDVSKLVIDPPQPDPTERNFIRLHRATEEQRTSGLNPSAWVIDQFPVTFDGSIPQLDCA